MKLENYHGTTDVERDQTVSLRAGCNFFVTPAVTLRPELMVMAENTFTLSGGLSF